MLLTSRIFEILPSRIQQWQAKHCVSEFKNKEQLEKIRQQQLELRKQLVELDRKHQEIDALIEKAKKATIASEEEVMYTFQLLFSVPSVCLSWNVLKNEVVHKMDEMFWNIQKWQKHNSCVHISHPCIL